MKARAIVALVAIVHSLAAPAFAQQTTPQPVPGGDSVFLKNGDVHKGSLVELVSGDHVTLLLGNGQSARILWSVIDHIERQVAQQAASAPPPSVSATVLVHIEADKEVTLEEQHGNQWVPVCDAPCDRVLPVDATYRIGGSGVRATSAIRLEGKTGQRVVLDVNTSSKAGFVGGIILVSVTPVTLLIGLVALAVGAVEDKVSKNTSTSTVGGVLVIGSLVGLGVGIFLIASNSKSTATQQFGPTPPPPVPHAAARTPPWNTAFPSERDAPKFGSVPLWSGSF